MTELIDPLYFQELAAQKPEEVCRRALCRYDETKRAYILHAWNDEYIISPDDGRFDRMSNNNENPHEYFFLFAVYYLLRAKEVEISNEWISDKDIPGGATFFRGPHEIPTHLISRKYGNDIERLRKRCEELHGTVLDMADVAYRFIMTPRIPVAVLYWKGDDEFPPEAKILYDRTITEHLTSDIIFALAVEICTRIGNTSDKDMV